MFDMGWSELLLVAVLAIVFVGPKDLPRLMRTVGQYVAKMRGMAREFQNSFEELARESELEELRKQVAEMRENAMKPLTDLERSASISSNELAKPEPPESDKRPSVYDEPPADKAPQDGGAKS
ncbi:MAG: Sec-independent protein translocase protein TatB [Parvibaculum sp.]